MAIYYQIKAVDLLGKGKVDEANTAINSAIDLEMSWLNYVLLGKVYEMKGENRLAADSYITAFNLRPGETLYWIETGFSRRRSTGWFRISIISSLQNK